MNTQKNLLPELPNLYLSQCLNPDSSVLVSGIELPNIYLNATPEEKKG